MAVYSIKDLEKLTGIKAHTIRIWEQRFGLIEPSRTASNIRFYTDEELKHLFNIALLNKNGLKISRIASLSKAEIQQKVAAVADNNIEQEAQLDALTLAMIDMDEPRFDRIVNQNIEKIGFERTMMQVIYPFFDKLNLLWLTGSVNAAHEGFISNLIRQKLIAAIDRLPQPVGRDPRTFLLYLPEGETQELSLLFMQFLIRARKNRVIYLGQHISADDLREAWSRTRAPYIFTVVSEPLHRQSLQNYLDNLHAKLPNAHFLCTGQQFFSQPVRLPSNATVFRSLAEAVHFLDEQRERPLGSVPSIALTPPPDGH